LPYISSQNSKSISVLAVSIKNFSVTPSGPWYAGQVVTLKAQFLQDSNPRAGITVKFCFNVESAYDFKTATTGSDGYATLSYTIPHSIGTTTCYCKTGNFYVYDDVGNMAGPISGKVAARTRISISAPDSVKTGQTFTISGKLEYESSPGTWSPLSGKTVSLYYNSTKIGDVTTDAGGNYSKSTSISTSGTYSLKASYGGEGLALPAFALFGMEVTPPEIEPIIQYASYALAGLPVLVVGGAIAVNEFMKKR